jgi:S-formylglutathione hydrolase FrmB
VKQLALLVALAACSAPPPPATATSTSTSTATATASGSRVDAKQFHSDALGVDKHVLVYVPADYDAHPTTRYPVFYYLHGMGGNESDWVKAGKLDAQADAIKLQAIVVMPDGDDSFYVDAPTPIDYDACIKDGTGLLFASRSHHETCVRANNYETYITKDLVGWVDTTYRTIASREGRGIAGLSMGGYGALVLALRHQDEFSAAASHSGVDSILYAGPHPYDAASVTLLKDPRVVAIALGDVGRWLLSRFGNDLDSWKKVDPGTLVQTLEPGKLALYLDAGTEDDLKLNDAASYLHDQLTARHIEHEFFLGPGGHNFVFWAARVPFSLAFLRDHVSKPA